MRSRTPELEPDDLVVRDRRFWERNEARLQEMGALAGEIPLPSGEPGLLSPLVRRTLSSPLRAVSLGEELLEGRFPAELAGLASAPDPARWRPRTRDGDLPTDVPDLVRDLAAWLAGVEEELRTALPRDGVHPDLAGWMLDSVPRGDVKTARGVLDRWKSADTAPLARRLRTFAHSMKGRAPGGAGRRRSPA